MIIVVSEMYGRDLKVNDYFLCCLYDWNFNTVVVGRVYGDTNYMVMFGGKYCNIYDCPSEPYVHRNKIYKLTGDTELFCKYHQMNTLNSDLIQEKYHGECITGKHKLLDIFGRKLCLGDFVFYKKKKTQLSSRGVSYGIVVDESHILTRYDVQEKPVLVYKVGERTKEEDVIYREIQGIYADKVKNYRDIKAHNDLKIGDVYRRGSYAFVYMGKYLVTELYDKKNVKHVYLMLDMRRQKAAVLLKEMSKGDFSNLSGFINNSSTYHNIVPNCFYFVDTPKFRSGYSMHIDLTPTDYVFNDEFRSVPLSFLG